MAIPLQITYSQKGKKVVLYDSYVHSFRKKRNSKSDRSYQACWCYREKTCKADLHAQEIKW